MNSPCEDDCDCQSTVDRVSRTLSAGLARRDFLRLLGASGLASLALRPSDYAMAGPFTREDFENFVPSDKRLTSEWVKSLTTRGEQTVYRGTDLEKIGMPIGGICAGQLYLGGDGKLWHWDIFNHALATGAEHYAHPMRPSSPLDQGFALRVKTGGKTNQRAMDAGHWKDVSFTGEYPIGYVTYADADCPVSVSLEAFSPFIPLNVDDSSLPATVLQFTLENYGTAEVEGELAGWLENAVCLHSARKHQGVRRNRVVREPELIFLACSAEARPTAPESSTRPDITFDDFETETYTNWTVKGTAFGSGPVEAAKMPAYQGDVGAQGTRLADSHATAPGHSASEKDAATGRLTSRSFVIERHYICFLIRGGNHEGKTCINLLVDGKVILSATGPNDNRLQRRSWDVRQWAGQTANFEIVDEWTGSWGNIGVDDIVFSDHPSVPPGPLEEEEDFGTMGLALLDAQPDDLANASVVTEGVPPGSTPSAVTETAAKNFGEKLVGLLARKFKLAPKESVKVTFLISWFMPNLKMNRLPPGRFYATKFDSAYAVASHLAKNFDRLVAQTRLWHDTWYVTRRLPYWFLDRTLLNVSTLATRDLLSV